MKRFFIKSPVFPFAKFPGVDPILSPEMHSTGEVMGIGDTFGEAYGKAMMGAGLSLPSAGKAFLSVNDADKGTAVLLARKLASFGFRVSWPHSEQQRGCSKSEWMSRLFSRSTKADQTSWTTSRVVTYPS